MPRYLVSTAAPGAAPGADAPWAIDERLVCRDWGDERLVYDGATGDCHLLTATSGTLLGELIQAAPQALDAPALFARTFGDESPPSAEELAVLELALQQLLALGLVHAAAE